MAAIGGGNGTMESVLTANSNLLLVIKYISRVVDDAKSAI